MYPGMLIELDGGPNLVDFAIPENLYFNWLIDTVIISYTSELLEFRADDPKIHVLFIPGNPGKMRDLCSLEQIGVLLDPSIWMDIFTLKPVHLLYLIYYSWNEEIEVFQLVQMMMNVMLTLICLIDVSIL